MLLILFHRLLHADSRQSDQCPVVSKVSIRLLHSGSCTSGKFCQKLTSYLILSATCPKTLTVVRHWALAAGDLLAALLLARLDQTPGDLKTAVELALASLQHIVYKTYEYSTSRAASKQPLPEVSSWSLESTYTWAATIFPVVFESEGRFLVFFSAWDICWDLHQPGNWKGTIALVRLKNSIFDYPICGNPYLKASLSQWLNAGKETAIFQTIHCATTTLAWVCSIELFHEGISMLHHHVQAVKMRELQLIPNQHLLHNPEVKLRAVELLAPSDRDFMGWAMRSNERHQTLQSF